jgi:sugar phosphate isomerase/epimerase
LRFEGTAKMKRPFRIGTTSFIYPDHILPNVRKIGRVFDEIELLIFESEPSTVLPDRMEITELARLSETLNVAYNIHLPTDVSLTHASCSARQHAADTIARVVDLCRPLAPSTHTLHLEMGGADTPENRTAWQARAEDGLERLMRHVPDPGIFSVETLDYSPDCLVPLLAAFELRICLDIGHHFRYGYDLNRSAALFQGRMAVIHLHGVTVQGPCRSGLSGAGTAGSGDGPVEELPGHRQSGGVQPAEPGPVSGGAGRPV